MIEEGDATLRRSPEGLGALSDDVMVAIEQIIDQDVNVFDGARLKATSERDLFASGVLPIRTPGDVYRAIVLERLPSFVRQDAIGGFKYILAAAPVRAVGEDALLTVPLALRQQEIEREIDELDRGVHLAALCLRPARRRDRTVDGGADRRSGSPPDARHGPHRPRRFRCPHCGEIG